jgi:hypothetical protein
MMEHKPVIELQAIADVQPVDTLPAMNREERLKRWIIVLEADPNRKLRSLQQIEYLSEHERQAYRSHMSPLTVAYQDPVLRAQGLNSDRIGDCVQFFEITDRQMHHAFCYCHVGRNLDAGQAAQRLRSMLPRESPISAATRNLAQRIAKFFAAR